VRKQLTENLEERHPGEGDWLNLEDLARVELTSEDAIHPIEDALSARHELGWRAAKPGTQKIRVRFYRPQRLRRIRLRFVEQATQRTQEFALRWSADGSSFHEVVRQQYTFSPDGATSEVEDLSVDLGPVTTLELSINPDQGRGLSYASLAEWRMA
jgi:hypothetical protein